MRRPGTRLVLLALSACSGAPPAGPAPAPPAPEARAPEPEPPPPPPSTSDCGKHAFAVDLYGRLRHRPGNVAFSPISVFSALAMTWAGAREETAADMKAVLHADTTPGDAGFPVAMLARKYYGGGPQPTLRVANRLFVQMPVHLEQSFLDVTRSSFRAEVEAVDFQRDPNGSIDLVNRWVAKETNDRIQQLVTRDAITKHTRLVLANAVYFAGTWRTRFDPSSTSPSEFQTPGSARRMVPTMHAEAAYAYTALDGVEILEMDYAGGELAMTVILPDAVDGLATVEERLSTATLDRWLSALVFARVIVSLPRFTIQPAQPIDLGKPLRALGMSRAFDPGRANFKGIDASEPLYLSGVYHKVFVKVDETGTEAAAATTADFLRRVSSGPPRFKADHPFLFLVRELRSGTIPFMERVNDPAAT